jgi:hypothetical protein
MKNDFNTGPMQVDQFIENINYSPVIGRIWDIK